MKTSIHKDGGYYRWVGGSYQNDDEQWHWVTGIALSKGIPTGTQLNLMVTVNVLLLTISMATLMTKNCLAE